MRRLTGCWIVGVLCMFGAGGVPVAHAAPAGCAAQSSRLLAALVKGDYAAARVGMDPAIRNALAATTLGKVWTQEQAAYGEYQAHGVAVEHSSPTGSIVFTPLQLASTPQVLEVSCDATGAINGLHILPPAQAKVIAAELAGTGATKGPASIAAQTLADGVRIEPLAVPSPAGLLRGALTLPAGAGPFPAVVLVAGSGPHDMDETVEGNKPFKDLAEGLAKVGIASLRYDKRTFDYPGKVGANPGFTVDDEVTDDALAALRLLAQQTAVDPQRVFVLGHSLGAEMAPRIAKRDPQLAGAILLAAPARPFLALVAAQLRELGPAQGMSRAALAHAEQAIADERQLLANANPASPPKGSFAPIPGGPPLSQVYLLSLHAVDQVATAKALTLPLLILQGGNDFQVSPTRDFDAWKRALAGKPNVTFHLFPGLSHLFMPGPTKTPADYAKPAHVAPQVIALIARWIAAQPAR